MDELDEDEDEEDEGEEQGESLDNEIEQSQAKVNALQQKKTKQQEEKSQTKKKQTTKAGDREDDDEYDHDHDHDQDGGRGRGRGRCGADQGCRAPKDGRRQIGCLYSPPLLPRVCRDERGLISGGCCWLWVGDRGGATQLRASTCLRRCGSRPRTSVSTGRCGVCSTD